MKATLKVMVDGREVVVERTYSFKVLNESAADDIVSDIFSEIEWGYEISPSPLSDGTKEGA